MGCCFAFVKMGVVAVWVFMCLVCAVLVERLFAVLLRCCTIVCTDFCHLLVSCSISVLVVHAAFSSCTFQK